MGTKSVSDLICDKFAETIQENALFKGISDDLIATIRRRRPKKAKIEELLRKKK